MTTKQAANRLNIHPSTLGVWIDDLRIEYPHDKKRDITESDLRKLYEYSLKPKLIRVNYNKKRQNKNRDNGYYMTVQPFEELRWFQGCIV